MQCELPLAMVVQCNIVLLAKLPERQEQTAPLSLRYSKFFTDCAPSANMRYDGHRCSLEIFRWFLYEIVCDII